MKKLSRFLNVLAFIFLMLASNCFFVNSAKAREDISDWYIKDFNSTIVVNKDSTLDITERITADCGNLPDKHGIFRVLPSFAGYEEKTIKTPVEMISISDFQGNEIEYTTEYYFDAPDAVYKIGDPAKTVKGVNYYEIKYKVKNTIRFDNSEFDEFYWNLNGNFWDIETDHFKANIIFPAEIDKENTVIDYYSGGYLSKDKSKANYQWTSANTLEVNSTQMLKAGEGITLSAAMPKNIFTPYVLTQEDEKRYMGYDGMDKYIQKYYPTLFIVCSWFLGLFFPTIIFILCFRAWKKHGDDPKMDRSIAPEFEIPEKLAPMELGLVYSNGSFRTQYFAATVINLAVKGVIKIEEVDKKWLLGNKDYKFISVNEKLPMSASEKLIVNLLFTEKNERLISSFKDGTLYSSLQAVAKTVDDKLVSQGFVDLTGTKYKIGFMTIGILLLLGTFFTWLIFPDAVWGVAASAIILIIFAIIMPKRTTKGLDLYYKILGFKLYMDTAEKYRQQFNEKEHIFEKFLPYAILFGITKEWTKKMEVVYKDQLRTYHPVWFIGGSIHNFDMNNFASAITAVSSSIGTASGASGAGGAGGGGGGGGGGGW